LPELSGLNRLGLNKANATLQKQMLTVTITRLPVNETFRKAKPCYKDVKIIMNNAFMGKKSLKAHDRLNKESYMSSNSLRTLFPSDKAIHSLEEYESIVQKIENRIEEHQETEDRDLKTFSEEMKPLLLMAKKCQKYNPADPFTIQYTGLSNEPCDAILQFSTGKEVKVEIVQAIDGHNEALRKERLKKCGSAPGSPADKIMASGSKHNRAFPEKQDPDFRSIDVHVYESIRCIESALKRKQDNKYRGYWLVIVVNELRWLKSPENTHINGPALSTFDLLIQYVFYKNRFSEIEKSNASSKETTLITDIFNQFYFIGTGSRLDELYEVFSGDTIRRR
jgi:hypothetical protein